MLGALQEWGVLCEVFLRCIGNRGEVIFPSKIIWGSCAPTKVSFLFFCLGSDLGPDPNYGPAQEERMGFGRFLFYV